LKEWTNQNLKGMRMDKPISYNQILRGDIFYADLNPVTGSEQGGIRPVLVISGNIGNQCGSTIIAAAVTSRHKALIPTHIKISGCGLREKSTVLLEQIRTISVQRLRERIGHVPPDVMDLVDEKLDISFGRVTKDKGANIVDKLTIIENSLIPVYQSEKGTRLVNMRELHTWLGVGRDFTTWIKDRIEKYGFVENQDYVLTLTKTGERQNVLQHEYIFKLDPAKEIAMVENNEKGKQIRKYFIHIEEKFKQVSTFKLPQSFAEALRLAADLEEEKQKLLSENTILKPKADSFDTFMDATGNLKINEVAKTLNIKNVGQNNMFKLLLKEKIIFKEGSGKDAYYLPKQEYESHFVVKQNPVYKGDMVTNRSQIYLTPEGLDWLAKKLIKRGYQANYGRVKQMSLI